MIVSWARIAFHMLLWLLLMAVLSASYVWMWLDTAIPIPPHTTYFLVNKGESLRSVTRSLHEKRLILLPNIWYLYSRFVDPVPIKAGEYSLSARESPRSILNTLQEGKVIAYKVTLVEGRTFSESLAILGEQEKLKPLLQGQSLERQLELLKLDIQHPEGWFFPDTYQYVMGDSDVDILRRAHEKMDQVLTVEWSARAEGLPYTQPHEALIMASIVEKETGVESERPDIAGVFVRRLQKGMRLQTDPTVIYGLGNSYAGNLTRVHLTTDTPYNTYTRSGLPPTPIAMPGSQAIHAALHPRPGDALYFVAKGDGTHYFSATLNEHNKAVVQFQRLNREQQYRSSPPVTSPSNLLPSVKSLNDAKSQ